MLPELSCLWLLHFLLSRTFKNYLLPQLIPQLPPSLTFWSKFHYHQVLAQENTSAPHPAKCKPCTGWIHVCFGHYYIASVRQAVRHISWIKGRMNEWMGKVLLGWGWHNLGWNLCYLCYSSVKARDLGGATHEAVAENLCGWEQGNEGQRKTGKELGARQRNWKEGSKRDWEISHREKDSYHKISLIEGM